MIMDFLEETTIQHYDMRVRNHLMKSWQHWNHKNSDIGLNQYSNIQPRTNLSMRWLILNQTRDISLKQVAFSIYYLLKPLARWWTQAIDEMSPAHPTIGFLPIQMLQTAQRLECSPRIAMLQVRASTLHVTKWYDCGLKTIILLVWDLLFSVHFHRRWYKIWCWNVTFLSTQFYFSCSPY